MAGKRTAKPAPPVESEAAVDVAALVEVWRANPFHYFTQSETRAMFNFGEDAMKALASMGAPVVAKKVNPDHLKAWLYDNRENVKKLLS